MERARSPLRGQFTQSRNRQKLLTRHAWKAYKEQINANRPTGLGKRLYAPRRQMVGRNFADAKELLHAHRYARFHGLAQVQARRLLWAPVRLAGLESPPITQTPPERQKFCKNWGFVNSLKGRLHGAALFFHP